MNSMTFFWIWKKSTSRNTFAMDIATILHAAA
jgi:hypothetical protein